VAEELFREMMSKLLAHAKAEQKILYHKLEKSRDSDACKFAFEGEVVESQLQQLARARNKDSEQWTARLTFLQEAVEKHVKEEESTDAHAGFDSERAAKTRRAFPARER
jgi:hemerythrin superfamily protein